MEYGSICIGKIELIPFMFYEAFFAKNLLLAVPSLVVLLVLLDRSSRVSSLFVYECVYEIIFQVVFPALLIFL